MEHPIPIDGFDNRSLVLRIGFWGRTRIVVDGNVVQPANGTYILRNNSGHVVPIRLRHRFLDVVPVVEMGAYEVEVLEPLRWYAYLWMSLPLLLITLAAVWKGTIGIDILWMVALGYLIGASAGYVSSRVLRTGFSTLAQYLVSGLCSAFSLVVFAVMVVFISFGLSYMRNEALVSKYSSFFDEQQREEIHGNKHSRRFNQAILPDSAVLDSFGCPVIPVDFIQLRSLLKGRRYQELNNVLQGYQHLFEQDFHCEEPVARAFRAFRVADTLLDTYLDEWVRLLPNSYQPYLARGVYREFLGWESRGYRWAKDTPEENFRMMEHYFAQAEEDLLKALTLEPRALFTYETLIGISLARGEQSIADLLLGKALTLCPYTFRPRRAYMATLLPRWGGSYDEMEGFALESEKFAHYNPKLRVLRGNIPWDQGRVAKLDSNYTGAIQLFTIALSHGDFSSFYNDRGNTYWSMKNYPAALNDFNNALVLSPQDEEVLLSKAKMLYFLGRLSESSLALDTISYLNSSYEGEILEWRQHVAQKLIVAGFPLYQQRQDEEAIALFNRAIAYHPKHSPAFYYRGMANIHLSRWAEAMSDLKTSISYDPHNLDSYVSLDWLLAQNGDWAQITQYWSRLIALEPGNARAYLERGGAYFHKGDLALSRADAQKACDLGNAEGCQRARQLGGS